MNITELAAQLRAEQAVCRSRADKFAEAMRQAEVEAEMLELVIDRILATDEGKSAISAPPGKNGAAWGPAEVRRPRRDIRGMVRAALSNGAYAGWSQDEKVAALSKDLGCRPSQIEAALRWLDQVVPLTDGALTPSSPTES